MIDGDLRIEVRSRSDILRLNELVFSSFGSSFKTFWARGCINGLFGMTVPALKDRSSKKLSRSAANFNSALSKSKSRFAPAVVTVVSVIVESLEVELLRTNPEGVGDLEEGSMLSRGSEWLEERADEAETADKRFGVVGWEDTTLNEDPLLNLWEDPLVGASKDGSCASSSAWIGSKSSVKLPRAFLGSGRRCSPYEIESMPAIQK
jgi:hypothetical protein